MDECCNTCKYCLELKKYDYSHGGCEHSDMEGFVCMVFEYEGLAVQMVGINKHTGFCEGYSPVTKK